MYDDNESDPRMNPLQNPIFTKHKRRNPSLYNNRKSSVSEEYEHRRSLSYTIFEDVPSNIYLFFSAPVIPQTGLPGGAAGGAGKKASKVPGYVASTIN